MRSRLKTGRGEDILITEEKSGPLGVVDADHQLFRDPDNLAQRLERILGLIPGHQLCKVFKRDKAGRFKGWENETRPPRSG